MLSELIFKHTLFLHILCTQIRICRRCNSPVAVLGCCPVYFGSGIVIFKGKLHKALSCPVVATLRGSNQIPCPKLLLLAIKKGSDQILSVIGKCIHISKLHRFLPPKHCAPGISVCALASFKHICCHIHCICILRLCQRQKLTECALHIILSVCHHSHIKRCTFHIVLLDSLCCFILNYNVFKVMIAI